MQIEYEAKFINFDKEETRKMLKRAGAKLIRPEFLQKRIAFDLPYEFADKNKWLRVRDEADKITLSYKVVDGNEIHNQKEICLKVDDFDMAAELLDAIGCRRKSYQETKRELWVLDEVEVTIDEWPFLEPFLEVEGKSEDAVQKACKKLGLDYNKAKFCSVTPLYMGKYEISGDIVVNIPKITFEGANPFLKF